MDIFLLKLFNTTRIFPTGVIFLCAEINTAFIRKSSQVKSDAKGSKATGAPPEPSAGSAPPRAEQPPPVPSRLCHHLHKLHRVSQEPRGGWRQARGSGQGGRQGGCQGKRQGGAARLRCAMSDASKYERNARDTRDSTMKSRHGRVVRENRDRQ